MTSKIKEINAYLPFDWFCRFSLNEMIKKFTHCHPPKHHLHLHPLLPLHLHSHLQTEREAVQLPTLLCSSLLSGWACVIHLLLLSSQSSPHWRPTWTSPSVSNASHTTLMSSWLASSKPSFSRWRMSRCKPGWSLTPSISTFQSSIHRLQSNRSWIGLWQAKAAGLLSVSGLTLKYIF